jgi:hypothetical protein
MEWDGVVAVLGAVVRKTAIQSLRLRSVRSTDFLREMLRKKSVDRDAEGFHSLFLPKLGEMVFVQCPVDDVTKDS